MADKTKYFDYETVKEMLYDLEYEGKDVDPNDYPFIEIADEHGRCIDADAVKEILYKRYLGRYRRNDDFNLTCDILDNAPTVLERTT